MEWMRHLFSLVCGQVNVWTVGGEVLPFCQRCTGLYVGGLYSVILMIVFRPATSLRLLAVHVLLLLQMVPFGYHLVEQGAVARTITGQVFALGLIYCLSFNPLSRRKPAQEPGGKRLLGYALAALAGVPLLLLAVRFGGATTALLLKWMGLAGLAAYVALAIANLLLLPRLVWQRPADRPA